MTDTQLKNRVIEKSFSRMNDMQFRAVTETDGPVLVLAGAGSGKTTVLVNRIACLIKYGNAYKTDNITLDDFARYEAQNYINGLSEKMPQGIGYNCPKPYQILAITFTNKAANELKERIAANLGDEANDIWAGTFHSICGKILRRNAEKIGYTSHFTIYDTSDQQKLMKELIKQSGIDESMLSYKTVLKEISSAKDKLITPEEYAQSAGSDYRNSQIAKLYKKYNASLINNDAMDFDDMIVNTVKLLEEDEETFEYYSDKFRYIMVDEYQDTNHAQYMLVKLLAQKHGNICVVGDDDQSIYRFRGATIENILSFESEYKNAEVIRLEQNYRSTGNILNAANAVIRNNAGRKGKELWTNNGDGEKVTVYTASDEREEAKFVADSILENVRLGQKFSDHAVLYRMNAQSNALENVFARSGISYRVIGGMKFFERKEIKDILSYLAVINNPYDDLRLKRIINEPKRGIGNTTVENASQISQSLGVSLFEVFKTAADYPIISRSAVKLKMFTDIIESLRESVSEVSLHELLELTASKTGYMSALVAAGPEEQDRIDNIKELSSSIMQYEQESEDPTLSGFLEQISLFSDIDSLEAEDKTVMMTVHSAKGLEFKNVYIVGFEDNIFPGNQSIYGGPELIEEERRLAYVAITRAKEKLFITNTRSRLLFGSTGRNLPSRFIKEIPDEFVDKKGGLAPSFTVDFTQQTSKTGFYQPNTSSYVAKRPQAQKDTNSYRVGSRVQHKTFGVGEVLKVSPLADDCLLEIRFENVGTKKLMANFAKLKII